MVLLKWEIERNIHWYLFVESGEVYLTHLPLDKMNAISQMIFSDAFSWMKMYKFWLRFHWLFFPKGSINNIPALSQIMAWRSIGDKPLSEPGPDSLTHICGTRGRWVNSRQKCSHSALGLSNKIVVYDQNGNSKQNYSDSCHFVWLSHIFTKATSKLFNKHQTFGSWFVEQHHFANSHEGQSQVVNERKIM